MEFLRQRYESMTVNGDCRSRMELEVSNFLPLHMRENLVVTVTDMELYLALRQVDLNKSPGYDGINLEFSIKYRDFM